MKYQCLECERIWSTLHEAEGCCQPAVFPLQDHLVVPCSANGEDCEDESCTCCQGTGWQWKPAEAKGASDG